ncbi:MAG: di-trans,poly-cis-decaprenylcistransferase [Gammaproteobacteria bacterium]|nr:di-trans,poly-cis-decaprenylcistransferase [Gammaproteobacteria bacterium]MBV8306977.1 di-trans,poly-cis-decaprenylcistransferase [Gammaproteobacteria bacterium]MBV8402900.1 di-trans,poly-cis-decaprenylcistransferase [Gammaproteobacteria bacterium]
MAALDLLPRHIAITMDGNGRWAAARGLPRSAGHKAGLAPVRMCIEVCSQRGVEALTLFAFSSENWRRPADEVGSLMGLFIEALDREIDELHQKSVRMRFIGERRTLSVRLQARIAAAEARTAANGGLKLQVAMSYGGRWDIVQAAQKVARDCASGRLRAEDVNEEAFAAHLSLAGLPEADLLIRTGGEQRISNFLLWDLAYAELHFSPRLWPDFTLADLEDALAYFAGRERRFGRVAAPRAAAKA